MPGFQSCLEIISENLAVFGVIDLLGFHLVQSQSSICSWTAELAGPANSKAFDRQITDHALSALSHTKAGPSTLTEVMTASIEVEMLEYTTQPLESSTSTT